MKDPNQFRGNLDKLAKNETDPDRLFAYNHARATICLYEEVYNLRCAINKAAEAVSNASLKISAEVGDSIERAKEAIEDSSRAIGVASDKTNQTIEEASRQSTALGRKLLALNWILVAVTIFGSIFAVSKLYLDFQEHWEKRNTVTTGITTSKKP
jgi:hypothetical protein